MKLFGKDGVSRRRFLIGGAAATAAATAAMSLSGCNGGEEEDKTGEPQFVDDDSQIIDALEEYADAEPAVTLNATWTLPLGTLLYHSDGVWAAAMMTPESATSINTLGVLSLTSGDLYTIVSSPVRGRTYGFHDVRCGSGIFTTSAKRVMNLLIEKQRSVHTCMTSQISSISFSVASACSTVSSVEVIPAVVLFTSWAIMRITFS